MNAVKDFLNLVINALLVLLIVLYALMHQRALHVKMDMVLLVMPVLNQQQYIVKHMMALQLTIVLLVMIIIFFILLQNNVLIELNFVKLILMKKLVKHAKLAIQ